MKRHARTTWTATASQDALNGRKAPTVCGPTKPGTPSLDATQWNDTDGDGYGDNVGGNQGDACPTEAGTSLRSLANNLDHFDARMTVTDSWTNPSPKIRRNGWTKIRIRLATTPTEQTPTCAQTRLPATEPCGRQRLRAHPA